jgi:hypothetical protein
MLISWCTVTCMCGCTNVSRDRIEHRKTGRNRANHAKRRLSCNNANVCRFRQNAHVSREFLGGTQIYRYPISVLKHGMCLIHGLHVWRGYFHEYFYLYNVTLAWLCYCLRGIWTQFSLQIRGARFSVLDNMWLNTCYICHLYVKYCMCANN